MIIMIKYKLSDYIANRRSQGYFLDRYNILFFLSPTCTTAKIIIKPPFALTGHY